MLDPDTDSTIRYEQGFAAVPDALIRDPRTSPYHIAVFAALATFANKADRAWPSQSTLATLTNCSRRKIGMTIEELVEWGWVVVERRGGFDPVTRKNVSSVYALQRLLQGRA